MSYSRLFSEVMHDPRIAMEESRFNASFQLIMHNLHAGVKMQFEPKTMATLLGSDGKTVADAKDYEEFCMALDAMSAASSGHGSEGGQDAEPYINMIRIEGAMTRNGDDCTYGSKDHKRMMMRAAQDPMCHGHILKINSGGGMVGTLLDYREAINYCLERGQNVAAVIDECGASAACFTPLMTNRIYATRPSDELGSLGIFAAFTTIADGTVLPQTNEVVHIRYAKQSKDKNREMREAANGNLKPIDDMLSEDLAEILADAQQDRPTLTKEQQTGKMYRADELLGTMVDEIGGVNEAATWLMSDWDTRKGAPLQVKNCAPRKKAEANADVDADENDNTNNNNKMYEQIASALGMESIEHTEEGVMLNTPLADQLEAHLQGHADALAQKEQEIADLNAANEQKVNELNEAHQQAMTEAENKHSEAMAQLNAEHEEAISAKDAAISENETALTEKQEALDQMQKQMEEAQAQIADLRAKVEDLNNQAPAVDAGAQPADNGQQMPAQPQIVSTVYQWDNSLSVDENMKRKAEFEKR